MSRTKKVDIRTRWEIELFPFDSIYPQKRGGVSGPPSKIGVGIANIRINRNKTTTAGSCTFSIIGQPPETCFPGTWIVATTVSFEIPKNGGAPVERKLIRFVGQIYDMTPDYVSVPETGLLQLRTSFIAREWSSMLSMPVRYDLNSIAQAQAKNASSSGISNFVGSGAPKGELSSDQYMDIVSKSFSAYELVHLILKLIGAIGANDEINSIKEFGEIKLPEVSLRMPSIPQTLLQRLGLKDAKANAPFTSGFVDVITGVQSGPANADGTWDGIWGRGSNVSIEGFKKLMDNNPGDRPVTLGLASLASMGDSAWNLITQHCDPSINEFFTDILYQAGANSLDIVAKPAIFVRDKPFLMRRFKDSVPTELGSWSVYDDLPRVYIDDVYIDALQLKNTFLNSPNFIRMNFSPQTLKSEIGSAIAQLEQTQLAPEMDRFGGQEFFVETQFLSLDVIEGKNSSFDLPEWYKKVRTVAAFWHAYDYRMASGSIRLRDDNIPITVGMNIQFPIGQFKIVGHVESIDITANIDPATGRLETITTIQLSRVVQELGGRLEFIPPNAMNSLTYSTPAPVADGQGFLDQLSTGILSTIKNIAGAFSTAINAIKEFFV